MSIATLLVGPAVDYLHYALKEKEHPQETMKQKMSIKKKEAYNKLMELVNNDHITANAVIAEAKTTLLI